MSNDIILAKPLSLSDWQIAQSMDQVAYQSRKYGLSLGELAIKTAVARELGLPFTAGIRGIHIINNIPTVAPKLAWALILNHPDLESYEEKKLTDDKGKFLGYEITIQRKNSAVKKITRRFTLDDAKRITHGQNNKKLIDKDNYQNYPENMCYWRALGFCIDVQWTDLLFGMPLSDAIGADITPDGDVIETSWRTMDTEQPKVIDIQQPDPVIEKLNSLTSSFGAEKVMTVSNGILPSTLEELAVIEEKLNEVQQ